MTQLFECIDGPYRGFIVTVGDNQTRIQVRDLAGTMQPEWYEIDPTDGGASLIWIAAEHPSVARSSHPEPRVNGYPP